MTGTGTLRVVDFGEVSALRSQTLWHALTYGVSRGSPPTLSFMRPVESYVSIGYHRSAHELDEVVCGVGGLPVFRRMVGGGPVYIDDGQHFFQIVLPLDMAAPRRSDAVRALLEPAVQAFNDVGIDAALDDHNEVVLGDRKICGHAAGQIGQAVVVVGNLINDFDHAAAASIVRAPSAVAQREFLAQMTRYVTATPADPQAFSRAASQRYAQALGLTPVSGEMHPMETAYLRELDVRFVDPVWIQGFSREMGGVWRVKVKSGVWVGSAATESTRVTLSVTGDRVRSIVVENGSSSGPLAHLAGLEVWLAIQRLELDGQPALGAMIGEMAAQPPP